MSGESGDREGRVDEEREPASERAASRSSETTPTEEVLSPDEVIAERVAEEAGQRFSDIVESRLEVTEHRGALPPPEVLTEYDRRFPGLGREIVSWTSTQVRHRQRLESTAVNAAIRQAQRGQAIGFVIVLLGSGSSCWARQPQGL
jgi:Flp pilus assembly CpaE family ATPase